MASTSTTAIIDIDEHTRVDKQSAGTAQAKATKTKNGKARAAGMPASTKQPVAATNATGSPRPEGSPDATIAAAGRKQPGTHGKQKSAASSGPSKVEIVLKKLRSAKGVTIAQLAEATGWQAHSVRGFLSGKVRKKLGLPLASEVGKDGPRRYRIDDSARWD